MPFPSAGDVGKSYQDSYPEPNIAGQPMSPMNPDEVIDEMFDYKNMNVEQNAKAMNVRLAAKNFAKVIAHNLYPTQHRERAIRKVHELMMICNWAISRER